MPRKGDPAGTTTAKAARQANGKAASEKAIDAGREPRTRADVRLAQYRAAIRRLTPDTAGRIDLAPDERAQTARARLRRAAQAEGKDLYILRRGHTLVFWERTAPGETRQAPAADATPPAGEPAAREERIVPPEVLALIAPDLRAAFQASWEQFADAYRYLAKH